MEAQRQFIVLGEKIKQESCILQNYLLEIKWNKNILK